MKVSIIVPIYNVEKYLCRCLDSILDQTFTDYELILVDDGSTDSSGELAEGFGSRDSRISIYHKKNGGLSDARNYGIERAGGEYLCFIDSDDWVEKNYLGELVRLIEEYEADIAICGFKRNSGDEDIIQPQDPAVISESGTEAIDNLYGSHYTEYVVAWNKLYKKEIFDGIRYTEGMIHEDEAICGEVYCRARKVVRTDKVLYNYRSNNSSSIMTSGYSVKRLDILKALELRMETYRRYGLQKYYEKDSFKYLYKILLNEIEIRKLDSDNREIIKGLKEKYWTKYKEALGFDWSIKRKLGMLFFGLFPKAYLIRYKKV